VTILYAEKLVHVSRPETGRHQTRLQYTDTEKCEANSRLRPSVAK